MDSLSFSLFSPPHSRLLQPLSRLEDRLLAVTVAFGLRASFFLLGSFPRSQVHYSRSK
nr:MAG TPA: hypothetical protein [Caudoviricetes sp.]